jgi:hypothetical protein
MLAVWGKVKNQAKFISKRFFLYALKNGKERRINPFLDIFVGKKYASPVF